MIAQNLDATQICADQLTEGEITCHSEENVWQIISEPECVSNGISFEVLCMDVGTSPNTQQVIFAASWRFELPDYQPLMTA